MIPYSEYSFSRWDSLPEDAQPGRWLKGSRLILCWNSKVEPVLEGRIFETPSGEIYLKLDIAKNVEPNLSGGVFVEVADQKDLGQIGKDDKPRLFELKKFEKTLARKRRTAATEAEGLIEFLWRLDIFWRGLHAGVYQFAYNTPARSGHPIRSLSPEEQAHQSDYFHSRFNSASSTEPINYQRASKAIEDFYASIGLAPPRVIIVPNPLTAEFVGQIAASVYSWSNHDAGVQEAFSKARGLNWKIQRMFEKSWLQKKLDVMTANRNDNAYFQEQRLVRSISGGTWTLRGSKLETSILGWVYEVIANDVTARALDAARRSAAKQFLPPQDYSTNELITRFGHNCCARLWAGNQELNERLRRLPRSWQGVLDMPNRTSIFELCYWYDKNILGLPESQEIELWNNVKRECGNYIWLHEDFCVIAERPMAMEFDSNRNLHNASGPAVAWRDGSCRYFIHGRSVSQRIVMSPETITAEMLIDEVDVELRRIMLRFYGEARFLAEIKAEPIHEDQFGILYIQPMPNDEPLCMVRVRNSTPEADGSYKHYYLRVPPTMRTARQAVAWTFGLWSKQYDPTIET